MDTVKSLMSTMADTITRQVSEPVKKAMDAAAGPCRGAPHLPEGKPSLRLIEHGREVMRSDTSAGLPLGRQGGRAAEEPQERTPAPPPSRDEECSTEIVTTIAGGYTEEITWMAWKAQLRSAQQLLAVDFLVVDVPTAYNAIIGRLTLYKVKAVVAPYLLLLQFEVDDGNIGELCGDQRTAWECHLVSIKALIERTRERGTSGPSHAGKRAKVGPATPIPETLVIHTLASSEPPRPHPEVMDAVDHLPPGDGRPEHTVQLGQDISAEGWQ
ncbi:hypothetical protein Cgig2_021472 [Carnegiea gigantea]|uniref:Uncharacterized protein n=1 Tax=Carnegiea gigantea TaxID=171969 RepID=A0A9Q1GGB6_9CARY|nr:hypothetical protein Cgig2_021472 [Carnegiea gigantea]